MDWMLTNYKSIKGNSAIFKIIDAVSTIGGAVVCLIFVLQIKDKNNQSYFLNLSLNNIDFTYISILLIVVLLLLRSVFISIADFIVRSSGLEYIVYSKMMDDSRFSIEKMINKKTEAIYITAQNWAGSFPQIKERLKEFVDSEVGKSLTIVLTDPEILKWMFESKNAGRASNDGYAHMINKAGGTLSQIHEWLSSLSNESRKKIKIYIHPGATSLSSHLLEYMGGKKVLVITPKYATASYPRLSLRIDGKLNKDAFDAISNQLNAMTQSTNTTIDSLFKKYGIITDHQNRTSP